MEDVIVISSDSESDQEKSTVAGEAAKEEENDDDGFAVLFDSFSEHATGKKELPETAQETLSTTTSSAAATELLTSVKREPLPLSSTTGGRVQSASSSSTPHTLRSEVTSATGSVVSTQDQANQRQTQQLERPTHGSSDIDQKSVAPKEECAARISVIPRQSNASAAPTETSSTSARSVQESQGQARQPEVKKPSGLSALDTLKKLGADRRQLQQKIESDIGNARVSAPPKISIVAPRTTGRQRRNPNSNSTTPTGQAKPKPSTSLLPPAKQQPSKEKMRIDSSAERDVFNNIIIEDAMAILEKTTFEARKRAVSENISTKTSVLDFETPDSYQTWAETILLEECRGALMDGLEEERRKPRWFPLVERPWKSERPDSLLTFGVEFFITAQDRELFVGAPKNSGGSERERDRESLSINDFVCIKFKAIGVDQQDIALSQEIVGIVVERGVRDNEASLSCKISVTGDNIITHLFRHPRLATKKATFVADTPTMTAGQSKSVVSGNSYRLLGSVTRLFNLTTLQRQFVALKGFRSSPIADIVVHPRKYLEIVQRLVEAKDVEKQIWGYLPKQLWDHYCSTLNESQLRALACCLTKVKVKVSDTAAALVTNPTEAEKAMASTIVGQEQEGSLVMLQGPPGCGKTRCALALMNAFHCCGYQEYYGIMQKILSKAQSAYNSLQSGGGSQEELKNRLHQVQQCHAYHRPHILVCAPSNAAVDEIAARVISDSFLGWNLATYDPKLLRVGADESISGAVRHLYVESVVKGLLSEDPKIVAEKQETAQRRRDEMLRAIKAAIQSKVNYDPSVVCPQMEGKDNAIVDLAKFMRIAQMQQAKSGNEEYRRLEQSLKGLLIDEADIVFATLSASGMGVFAQSQRPFDLVVIDEAAQAVELETLCAIQRATKSVVLIGDPAQLQATTTGISDIYSRSLFERLMNAGYPVVLLNEQYRMHPDICAFPSALFYDRRVKTATSVRTRKIPLPLQSSVYFEPYMFFDVVEGEEKRSSAGSGQSFKNEKEAQFVVSLYQALVREYQAKKVPLIDAIAIITPYKGQARRIREVLLSRVGPSYQQYVVIASIDAFQGQERDIVIFSAVRASTDTADKKKTRIGFLSDYRRMNVALTRARHCLMIVGSAASLSLSKSVEWRRLVDDAKARKAIRVVQDVFSVPVKEEKEEGEVDDDEEETGDEKKEEPAPVLSGAISTGPPGRTSVSQQAGVANGAQLASRKRKKSPLQPRGNNTGPSGIVPRPSQMAKPLVSQREQRIAPGAGSPPMRQTSKAVPDDRVSRLAVPTTVSMAAKRRMVQSSAVAPSPVHHAPASTPQQVQRRVALAYPDHDRRAGHAPPSSVSRGGEPPLLRPNVQRKQFVAEPHMGRTGTRENYPSAHARVEQGGGLSRKSAELAYKVRSMGGDPGVLLQLEQDILRRQGEQGLRQLHNEIERTLSSGDPAAYSHFIRGGPRSVPRSCSDDVYDPEQELQDARARMGPGVAQFRGQLPGPHRLEPPDLGRRPMGLSPAQGPPHPGVPVPMQAWTGPQAPPEHQFSRGEHAFPGRPGLGQDPRGYWMNNLALRPGGYGGQRQFR